MKRILHYIKDHPRFTTAWIIVIFSILLMLHFNVDKKLVALVTILIAWFTNAFIGIGAFISLVPVIGPIIVKLFTIPFFWLMNGAGYFTSAYAIKKGYKRNLITHRLMTLLLLVGIIIGYILGHLIPVK